jgi:hypothetical protein
LKRDKGGKEEGNKLQRKKERTKESMIKLRKQKMEIKKQK